MPKAVKRLNRMTIAERQAHRRRQTERAKQRLGQLQARLAFEDAAMLEGAHLIVWSRAQMNGVRSTIKRLGLA